MAAAARPFLQQQVPPGAGGAGAQCTSPHGVSPKSPSRGSSAALPAVPSASQPNPLSPRWTPCPGLARPCKIRNAARPECNPLAATAFHLPPRLKCSRSRRKLTRFPRKCTCHTVRNAPRRRQNSSPSQARRPTRAEIYPHVHLTQDPLSLPEVSLNRLK